MEVVSIVKIIEKIEVACHSAECIIVNCNALSGFDNSEMNLLLRYAFDGTTGCTTEENGAGDSTRCATHFNETLRTLINLVGSGTVAVYFFYDGVPISARPCEQSCEFIGECGIIKRKVCRHYQQGRILFLVEAGNASRHDT